VLLVPHQHVGDFLLSIEGIVDANGMTARHPEDKLDPFGPENINNRATRTHLCHQIRSIFGAPTVVPVFLSSRLLERQPSVHRFFACSTNGQFP
jgi:hypothetical protein